VTPSAVMTNLSSAVRLRRFRPAVLADKAVGLNETFEPVVEHRHAGDVVSTHLLGCSIRGRMRYRQHESIYPASRYREVRPVSSIKRPAVPKRERDHWSS